MSRWTRIAAVVIGAFAIAIATLFFMVKADTFRPLLEKQLSTALGRQVTIGSLRFAPFSGSLVANDLTIAGDPSYSAEPFLTAKELRIGVEMKPLVFSRRLEVLSFEAEEPRIHLVQGENGSWNFSTIGKNASNQTEQEEPAIPDLTIGRIVIRDGTLIVERRPANGTSRIYDHFNLIVRQFAFAKRFPFTLSASLPGSGEISMNGQGGPINQQDAANTAMDAQISIQHLDPAAAGFLKPDVGISMLADVDARATSDGRIVNSSGTVHMQRLRLTKVGSPSPKPVDVTYDVSQNLQNNTGELHSADIEVGKAAVHLSGTYRLDPGDPWLKLKVAGHDLPVDALQSLMIAGGVKLPNGAALKGGTLTIDFAVTGPANNLTIAGLASADNTRLVGFDVGSKISGIAALGRIKTGNTTDIQQLRLNLNATKAGTKITDIDALLPAVGEAVGSGTISPAGALDFHLIVKVTTASGLGKVGVDLLTKLNGTKSPTEDKASIRGVPMQVTGTANDPVIRADLAKLRPHRPSIRENTPKAIFDKLFGRNKNKR